MALQTQFIDIPLGGGVEQHKTRELVEPPGVLAVADMDPSKSGGYVQRRAPYGRSLSSTGGALIERANDDLIAMNARGSNLFHYARRISGNVALTYDDTAESLELAAWSAKVEPVAPTFIWPTGATMYGLNAAYAGGYTAVVHQSSASDDAVVIVVDAGGAAVARESLQDAGVGVELVSDGIDIYAFWLDSGEPYAQKFTVSTLTWGARAQLSGSGISASLSLTLAAVYLPSYGFVLAGTNSAGTPRVAVCLVSTAFAIVATQTGGYSAGATALALYVDGTSVSVAGVDEGIDVYHHNLLFESFAFTAPATISRVANSTLAWKTDVGDDIGRMTIAGGSSSSEVIVVAQSWLSGSSLNSMYCRVTVASGTWGAPVGCDDMVLAHRGMAGGIWGILMRGTPSVDVSDQVVATIRVDADDHMQIIARTQLGTADVGGLLADYAQSGGSIPQIVATTSGSYAFPVVVRQGVRVSSSGRPLYSLGSALVKFSPRSFRSASASGTVYVAGGPVSVYDGEDFTDAGFAKPPKIVSLTGSVGSGVLSNGTYLVRCTWEWVDRNGNVHESAPGDSVSITLAGGGSAQKVAVLVIPVAYSYRRNSPKLVVYMTDVGGSVFYRKDELAAPGIHECAALTNDRITSTVGTSSDTSYGVVRALYTEGGELGHWASPPTDEIVLHGNRLWTISGEDGSLWPSLLIVDGVGVAWNPALAIVNPRKDRPKALASLGDRLAVFYEDEIGVVYGDGPDNTGAGGAFAAITILHHGVGALSREVTPTSMGVVFQARQGLMIMDQGGGLSPFPQIEDVIRVSGVADELLVGAGDSPADTGVITAWSNGDVWLYSQRAPGWIKSSISCDAGDGSQYDVPGRVGLWSGDAVVCGASVEDGDTLHQFSRTLGSHGECSLTTAWIRLAGLQGFQRIRRVWLLVENPGATSFAVSVRYDYDDADAETFAFLVADLSSLQGYPLCSVPIRPARQRCSAIAFHVANDASTDGEGLPLRIIGLRLEVGTLGRQRKNVAPAATGA